VTLAGTAPTSQAYIVLQESEGSPFEFVHGAFNIVTTPRTHTACGTTINYTATYDGVDITQVALAPISYDPSARTFKVYSATLDDVKVGTIGFKGVLNGYPATSLSLSFQLDI